MARSFKTPLPAPAPGESAVNAIPPVVLALFLLIAGAESVLSLADAGLVGGAGSIGWRVRAIEAFGFSPAVLDALATQGGPALWRRLVTYAFVHGGAVHALFAGALLLALGKFVGEATRGAAVLAIFVCATVAGAVAFGLAVDGARPLFGAYPGVYGLIGAFTYLLWARLGAGGGNRLQAFRLIGLLLALQLVFGLLFGSDPSWVADVAGFCAGFLVSPLVAPGGLAALRRRLRGR